MAQTRTVNSLAQVGEVLQDMGINDVQEHDQVRFLLHEETSLEAATDVKVRTHIGRNGFTLLNHELMECKFRTKIKLDKAFHAMYTATMNECNQELLPVEAHIAELRRLLNLPFDQIEDNLPDIMQRNRGLQHVIYPNPPVYISPLF
jgi:hypothetical protein